MSAAGKGGFPQGPQIGGGPAPAQPAQQPDIYSRYGGQPMVDSDPNLDGFQPPTGTPMQPPAQVAPNPMPMPSPGMPGGKSGPGGKGGFGPGDIITPFNPGPQIGGGPVPLDPNAPNPLGPEGQQPVTPQPPAGTPGMPGGKSAPGLFDMRAVVTPEMQARQLTPQDAYQNYSNVIFGTPGSNQQLDPNRVLL